MNTEPKNTPPPRIVCFDLGGVVIRIVRSWAEGCAAAGLGDRASDGPGDSVHRAIVDLIHELQIGAVDGHAFARGVSERLGGPWSAEDVMAVHRSWMVDEYAGVREVVEQIHACDIETAALSNTNHVHWEQLHEYDAFLAIRTRLASHELGLAKPDAAIYREMERRTGCAGTDVLFFDDLAENVEAARRVGWDAVLVDHSRETAPQMVEALGGRGVVVRI